VDFNPDAVKMWTKKGKAATYGDACDPNFIAHLPLKGVQWVVSAMPQHDIGLTHEDPRLVLIDTLKENKFKGKIAISTQNTDDVEYLKDRGADMVLLPFHEAAQRVVSRIKNH
jgi:Trk K+ transport system NAD-binding subunit